MWSAHTEHKSGRSRFSAAAKSTVRCPSFEKSRQSKRRVYVSGGTMATDNSDDLFSVAMLIDELKVRSASIVARPSRRVVRPSTTDRQKVTHGVFAHSFEEKPVRLPPEIRDRRAMRRRLHLPQPVSDLPLTSPIHI